MLLSTACIKEPQVRVERVEVPVPVPCPAPPVVPRPAPICPTLPAEATPQAKAQALVKDLSDWIAYALELEKILDGYRPTPAKPTEALK
jgi:hypothetical protein